MTTIAKRALPQKQTSVGRIAGIARLRAIANVLVAPRWPHSLMSAHDITRRTQSQKRTPAGLLARIAQLRAAAISWSP